MDTIDLQNRSNRIFQTIKSFQELFPDELEKSGIHMCGHCDGTGLGSKSDMESHCSFCGGFGYKGFEKLRGEWLCRSCNGYGCDNCDRTGIVDWIKHARGNDLKSFKKPYDYRPPEST